MEFIYLFSCRATNNLQQHSIAQHVCNDNSFFIKILFLTILKVHPRFFLVQSREMKFDTLQAPSVYIDDLNDYFIPSKIDNELFGVGGINNEVAPCSPYSLCISSQYVVKSPPEFYHG